MAEYVFKFFLKESEQDGCCSGNDIHEIINWEYTPSEGGTDSVSSVQNTVYNNDPTKYIYIEGNNLLDSENKIKGNLIVRYRCVPQCDLIKRNEATKLRAIQIDGFAAAITAPNNYIFVPIGETIKVQILGGVGPTRFASSENPSIASVSPRISSEDSTYRPEMQILGPEQVDNDCFVVDKPLNDGNHIFSITIKDSGPTKIIFKDEAGCKYYVHLHGAGNLCKHTVNSEQTAFATNYQKRNVDSDWFSEEKGIQQGGSTPCNCDFTWGNTFNRTYYLSSDLNGGLGLFAVYDSENFAHGTRTLNLPDPSDDKLFITHTVQKKVGDSFIVEAPEWGKNWNSQVVISEAQGSWGGHGYDSSNMLPWAVGAMNETSLIEAQNLTLNLKQPTNHAPVLVHVYNSDGLAVGPPNPSQAKKITVLNNGNGDLVYTQRDGTQSSIMTEDYGNPEEIIMTNEDWFIAVRAFCPGTQEPGLTRTQTLKEDDYFEVGFTRLDGGLDSLGSNNSWYFSPTDVGRPNDLSIRDNIVRSPDLDNKAPQRNYPASFQVGPGNQDVNQLGVSVTIFAEPWLFWSASKIGHFPSHKECRKAFESQYFKNGDFYENVDNETLGDHKHQTESDLAYKEYEEEGLTAQVRGSWCLQNTTFRLDLQDKLPVFEQQGKAKMLFDEKNEEVIVPEEILNNKRTYKFRNKGVRGPLQNGI